MDKSLKALIVEDSKIIQHAYTFALEDMSYDVQSAGMISNAVNLLVKNYYDIILISLAMLDKSGIEAIKIFRRGAKNKDTIIIATNARLTGSFNVSSLSSLCDLVLTRPISLEALKMHIYGVSIK
jgi:DNA-binding response OmpR family regulator